MSPRIDKNDNYIGERSSIGESEENQIGEQGVRKLSKLTKLSKWEGVCVRYKGLTYQLALN